MKIFNNIWLSESSDGSLIPGWGVSCRFKLG